MTKKIGRPTDYTEELAAYICERIASGESLNKICLPDDMPNKASVYLWLTKHQAFSDMYTRAREDQADTLADEIADIADDLTDDPNSRRVRVDARKWVAAKLKPRKYGDRTDHNVALSGKVLLGWQEQEAEG